MNFTAPFIKTPAPFDKNASVSPIFRRKFTLEETENAFVNFSALGFGYLFINGKIVSEDLFLSPFSEYGKLVYYNRYEVSKLLKKGENVIAVILGNGFYNESIKSNWNIDELPTRDSLRFALSLEVSGNIVLESDENFLCQNSSFVTFNELRAGETFDARLYDPNWKGLSFDDSSFEKAEFAPSSERRVLCNAEPIREAEVYDFVSAKPTKEGYLLDFGVNLSGYLRINVNEESGRVLEFHHAEEINEDLTLRLNRMDGFYHNCDFMVDRYVCGEKNYPWSPRFTYHGFRYVLIKGLSEEPKMGEFKAVFVHQDVKTRSDFNSSNETLNYLYKASIRSSHSNMFYMLTDCPTREKLGWTNDAAASLEQLYLDFNIERFMEKWSEDILVNMDSEGRISGVIPPYFVQLGCGPVCDNLLFKLPFIDYFFKNDLTMLGRFLPYMERYYSRYREGLHEIWLDDWDGHDNRLQDTRFVYLFYKLLFAKAFSYAKRLGVYSSDYINDETETINEIKSLYLNGNGECVKKSQTAISMLICLRCFDNAPLYRQLKNQIEEDGFALTSGMLGLQYLFPALFLCGMGDYAFRLLTRKGSHTYDYWREGGEGTTLWETFEEGHTDSRNHHMNSAPVSWFFFGFLGLMPTNAGLSEFNLSPSFPEGLDFCNGYLDLKEGRISAEWKREHGVVEYKVTLPEKIRATFMEKELTSGENIFIIKENEK